ncbi:hypothetical protein MMC19_005074 [Ptychographa xylographoides]|nr:hypothetical protein [Ptychographa xylographoides]
MRRMCWSHISNFRILGPCTLFCWLSSALADPSVSLAPVPVANTTALAATASITAPPASISIDYAQLSIYNPQGLFSTLSPSLSSFCVSSVAANYSSWALNHPDVTLSTFTQAGGTYTAVSTPLFQPAYSPPCCGQCTVELHQVVSVLYWPPATEAPAVTTTVNTDGFTLTYPSVYFQLAGVFATDLCTTAIGPQISKTIIAFPPESVSTARFISTPAFPDAHYRPPPVAGYAAVDFAQYASCSAATNSAYEVATSIPVTSVVSGTTLTWNLCFPWIPVPSQMQQLVPQWSSCTLGVYPLPDPPFALTPAAGVGTLVAAMPPAALASPTPPATPNAAFAPLNYLAVADSGVSKPSRTLITDSGSSGSSGPSIAGSGFSKASRTESRTA